MGRKESSTLPKHVRKMPEALARGKEAEERMRKEVEEKLRREEEERLGQKEKLLKKKLQGKLLTAKQKEEARRLEAMINQIFAKSGVLPTTEAGTSTTERPKYKTKKGKTTPPQANGVAPVKLEDCIEAKQISQDDLPEVDAVEVEKVEKIVVAMKDTEKDDLRLPEVDAVEVEKVEKIVSDTEQKLEGAHAFDDYGYGPDEEFEELDDPSWGGKCWDDPTLDTLDNWDPKKLKGLFCLGVKSAFDEEVAKQISQDDLPAVEVEKVEKIEVAMSDTEKDDLPEVDAVEVEKVEKIVSDTEQKLEGAHAFDEDGYGEDEESEDLDAMSWDDPTLDTLNNWDAKKHEGVFRLGVKSAFDEEVAKQISQGDLPEVDAMEVEKVEEIEVTMSYTEQKLEVAHAIEENGVEEDEDAKEWDATDKNRRKDASTKREAKSADATPRVSGLLVIDTQGHESSNLQSHGSGLCDAVDTMHGPEPQTIESLNLLKIRNTEFIVALNKVDRLHGRKSCPNAPIVKALKQQPNDVQNEFKMRLTQIVTQFKEQGLNTRLYYKNKEMRETSSIVPTSAISGEGIPDLLLSLVQWTHKTMVEKLMFNNEMQCTVLEVKVIEGLGTTIDVVLVNGVLHEGDQVVVCGMQVGTPICIPSREYIDIGCIASIEVNHKQVDTAKKGQKAVIKIVTTNPEEMFGGHFVIGDELVSHRKRSSIVY